MSLLGRRFPKDYVNIHCLPASRQLLLGKWADGDQHLPPEHTHMTCMLALQVCITWRAGESQVPALQARERKEARDQGWPRATPAASKRGVQLHLVDSQPPKCHQVPLVTAPRHGTPRAGAYGSAFPVTTGKQSQGMRPRPSAWDAPALPNAEAALTCGYTRCCKYAAASAHGHRLGREQ